MMTKTEFAKSMVEYIGIEKATCLRQREGYKVSLVDALYSSEGFIAVWEEVIKNTKNPIIKFCHYGSGNVGCFLQDHDTIGPDRYTAFYSAVHEMKNQQSEK